jgi:hypothetical protein
LDHLAPAVRVDDRLRIGGHVDPIDVNHADIERNRLEATKGEASWGTTERTSSSPQYSLMTLTAPVAASYRRNGQLAHENGVLSERIKSYERELEALREAAATDRQELERLRTRLEAVKGAHAASTNMLRGQADGQAPRRHHRRGASWWPRFSR